VKGDTAVTSSQIPTAWIRDHLRAAEEIVTFFEGDDISLNGMRIADIGTGDGIIAAGLALRLPNSLVVGFDIKPVDIDTLKTALETAGYQLPDNLSFVLNNETLIPAEKESFDCVTSWSVFEHVAAPLRVALEMRRILKPNGFVFLQLWPFYSSRWGSHIPNQTSEYEHLLVPLNEVRQRVSEELLRASQYDDAKFMNNLALEMSGTLNQIDLPTLQRVFLAAGLVPAKVGLYTGETHIPTEIATLDLRDLLIEGIKAIFVPLHL